MRRLVTDALLFILLQSIVGVVLISRATDRTGYLWAAADKHARLRALPSPRVIIIGGSSAAFGFNSDMITRRTGYPVVNMALHAGLGMTFYFREAADAVRAGDIVIAAPEYEVLCNDRPQSELIFEALRAAPEAIRCVPLWYLPALLDGALAYTGAATRQHPTVAPYVRAAFDGSGAIAERPPLPEPLSRERLTRHLDADPVRVVPGIRKCNAFYRQWRRRGAHAFFTYPPLPTDAYAIHRKVVQGMERELSAGLEMPRLGRAEDAVFPPSFFYDTMNHLTAEGAKRRTAVVLDKLVECLQVPGSPPDR